MKNKLILILISAIIICSTISAKPNRSILNKDENNWIDVGQVVDDNYFVSNLIDYNNNLYATHENKTYKYDGDTNWIFSGEIEFHQIRVLIIYNESLYAGTDFGSIHRYDADNLSWEYCGIAGPKCNHIHSFAVYNDVLYAGTYTGNVYRYDGDTIWTYVGNPGESTIELWVEELIVYQDELYAGKIAGFPPEGACVYRYMGGTSWSYVGEPGNPENPHINDLIVYKNTLYAGNSDNTISMYEGDSSWKIIDELSDGAVNCFQICKDKLYFGTADHFHEQTHFYSWDGENTWTDLGMPINGTGSLTALACHNNNIYGTGPVDFKGHVYRYKDYNNPPSAPTISGPISGKPGQLLTFTFSSMDPEGHDVRFIIDWGDGESETTSFTGSGNDMTASHSWSEKDTYTLTVKAEDEYGAIGIGTSGDITIPRGKAINRPILNFLQSRPYLFPFLQKLLQQLGLY